MSKFNVYVYEMDNESNKEFIGARLTLEKAQDFAELMLTRINYRYNIKIEEEIK